MREGRSRPSLFQSRLRPFGERGLAAMREGRSRPSLAVTEVLPGLCEMPQ